MTTQFFLTDGVFWIYALIVGTVAFLGSKINQTSIDSGWYQNIRKPSFTPDRKVFPIAWTILYILIAYSTYRADRLAKSDCQRQRLRVAFGLQISLNLAWSWVFFGQKDPKKAFMVILGLNVAALWQWIEMVKIDGLSALLFFPYLLWLIFATILNWSIYQLNK